MISRWMPLNRRIILRLLVGAVCGAVVYGSYAVLRHRPSHWLEMFGIEYRSRDDRAAFEFVDSPNHVMEFVSPNRDALTIDRLDVLPVSYDYRYTLIGTNGNEHEGNDSENRRLYTRLTIGHLYELGSRDIVWSRLLPFVEYIEDPPEPDELRPYRSIAVLDANGDGYIYEDLDGDGFLDARTRIKSHSWVEGSFHEDWWNDM